MITSLTHSHNSLGASREDMFQEFIFSRFEIQYSFDMNTSGTLYVFSANTDSVACSDFAKGTSFASSSPILFNSDKGFH